MKEEEGREEEGNSLGGEEREGGKERVFGGEKRGEGGRKLSSGVWTF